MEAKFLLPGYKPLINKLRRGNTQGGGVGIYVKKDIDYSINSTLSVFFDRVFESLAIEITLKDSNQKLKIITIYRPNSGHNNLKSFNNIWVTESERRQDINLAYVLRNSNNLYIPAPKLNSLCQHPLFLFPKLWHEFPDETIKIIRNKLEFKIKLKKYYLDKLSSNYKCTRLLCPHCHLVGSADNSIEDE